MQAQLFFSFGKKFVLGESHLCEHIITGAFRVAAHKCSLFSISGCQSGPRLDKQDPDDPDDDGVKRYLIDSNERVPCAFRALGTTAASHWGASWGLCRERPTVRSTSTTSPTAPCAGPRSRWRPPCRGRSSTARPGGDLSVYGLRVCSFQGCSFAVGLPIRTANS